MLNSCIVENFPLADLLVETSTGVETTANSSTSTRYYRLPSITTQHRLSDIFSSCEVLSSSSFCSLPPSQISLEKKVKGGTIGSSRIWQLETFSDMLKSWVDRELNWESSCYNNYGTLQIWGILNQSVKQNSILLIHIHEVFRIYF